MVRYINTQTKEYPVYEQTIRETFPNTSFATPFQPIAPFETVYNVSVPAVSSELEEVIETAPVRNPVSGLMERTYTVKNKFSTPEEEAQYLEALNKAKVPESITPLQAKLQLLEMNLLDDVDALVEADRKVKLYWEYALVIERNHPTLGAMALQLGLTDLQLDEMFIAASYLK